MRTCMRMSSRRRSLRFLDPTRNKEPSFCKLVDQVGCSCKWLIFIYFVVPLHGAGRRFDPVSTHQKKLR